jgi:hypothetical protein
MTLSYGGLFDQLLVKVFFEKPAQTVTMFLRLIYDDRRGKSA